MKKSLLLATLLIPTLALHAGDEKNINSSAIDQKNQYTPAGIDKFQEAVFLYKSRRYAEALELFNALSNSMIDSKKVDFYVGRCSYEVANYDLALAAYERVLINEPNNLRVKLEVAQTYLKMGMLKEAKSEYESVFNSDGVPENVKKNIQTQLSYIDGKTQKNFTTVMGIFGIGYDSNINTQADDTFLMNGQSTFLGANSATTTEAGFVLNHIYKIDESFYLQNSATIYGMRYNNHEEMNMGIFSLSSTPTKVVDKSMYALSVGADHVWFGGLNYLNACNLIPKFTYSIDKNMLYDLALKYSKKDFYRPNSANDTNTYELSNKLSYIDEKFGMFRGELILGRENLIEDVVSDSYSKEYYTLNFANTYSIDSKNALNTTLSGTQYWYEDGVIGFNEKRKDNRYSISTGIMNSYSKNLTLNLSVQYTNNTSNIVIYDYNKYTIKSYIYYSF